MFFFYKLNLYVASNAYTHAYANNWQSQQIEQFYRLIMLSPIADHIHEPPSKECSNCKSFSLHHFACSFSLSTNLIADQKKKYTNVFGVQCIVRSSIWARFGLDEQKHIETIVFPAAM